MSEQEGASLGSAAVKAAAATTPKATRPVVPGFGEETPPPSQVTFEGNAVSETLSTTASLASLAPTHRSPPSPAPSQASSELHAFSEVRLVVVKEFESTPIRETPRRLSVYLQSDL